MTRLVVRVDGVRIERSDVRSVLKRLINACGFLESFPAFKPLEVIAESCLMLGYTYPEFGVVYIDVFDYSNKFDPIGCYEIISRELNGTSSAWHVSVDTR